MKKILVFTIVGWLVLVVALGYMVVTLNKFKTDLLVLELTTEATQSTADGIQSTLDSGGNGW